MKHKLAYILPLLTGAMWGSSGTFVRRLSDFGADTFTVLACRAIIAAVILFAAFLITNRSLLKAHLKDIWVLVMCGIMGTFALNICYTIAINSLSLSLAAVLLSLAPVYVVMLASIFFKEAITKRKILCMCMAIVGCMLVSGILDGGFSWSLTGVVCGVLAGFFCALYSVFSKIATKRGYHAFTITFYSMLSSSIAVIPFTDWSVIVSFVQAAPAGNSLFLVACSVLTIILPYILFTTAMKYGEAGKVSIISSGTEPSAAMIFGILIFAEIPSITSFAGLVLTIIALAMLCRTEENN